MRYPAAVIFGALCIPYSAYSQVSSGTVVVYVVMQDKAVIAADSRGEFVRGAPPNDTYCKITAFGDHVIFAVAGSAVYVSSGTGDSVPAWSAMDAARSVHKFGAHALSASSAKKAATVDPVES